MRRLAVTVVALLCLALVPVSPAGACGGPIATLDTLYLETKWSTTKWVPGSTVRVEVTVTRPNDEDPARQHIPTPRPTTQPAEGAGVGTTVYFRNTHTWASGVSDADGKAIYELEIPRNTKPGPVDAPTGAKVIHNEGGYDCTQIEEVGYIVDPVKVVRP